MLIDVMAIPHPTNKTINSNYLNKKIDLYF
jgi:hypothetical protein